MSNASVLSRSSLPAAPAAADTRAAFGTLLSMILVVLWVALAAGVVLTVVFPERSVSMSASSLGGWGGSMGSAR